MNQAGTQHDSENRQHQNGAPAQAHNGMDNGMNIGSGEGKQHGIPAEQREGSETQVGNMALPSADNTLPGNAPLDPSVLLALAEQTFSKPSGGAHNPGKRKRDENFQPGPAAPQASVPQMPAQGLQATGSVPLHANGSHDIGLGVAQELVVMPSQQPMMDPQQVSMMDQFNQRSKVQPGAGMQSTPGSFEDGYSQGFLAGLYYIQQNMQTQGAQKASPGAGGSIPHMAKSWQVNSGPMSSACALVEQTAVFNITKFSPRRPYRFCSKCWIKNKKWVLRSIKLPSGRSINLHGDMCPEWPAGDEQPSAIQMRAYGAAFKQAQRSSQLHSVALEAFKQAAPEMTQHELQDHLCGS